MNLLGSGVALLRLFRHWSWLVPLAEAIARKEAAVARLHPGEAVTLATTDATLFGEDLALSLAATRKA